MAENSFVTNAAQIGKETTAGTAVAAGKRPAAMSLMLKPELDTKIFNPRGFKYPTVQVLNKDWSSLSMEGVPTYDEIAYVFSSLIKGGITPTGTTEKTWVWTPSTTAEDVPDTFTIEEGSGVQAHKAAYGLFTDFSIQISREEVSMKGGGIAQNLAHGITLTSTPTQLPLVPMEPARFDIYMDTTSGGLGGTKLTRVLSAELSIGTRFVPVWTVNSANASWAFHVEAQPSCELKILVEADVGSSVWHALLRNGTTGFFRIEAKTAANISGSALPYRWTFDAAMKFSAVGEWKNEQELEAIEFTLTAYHDATWGKAYTTTLVNTLASL